MKSKGKGEKAILNIWKKWYPLRRFEGQTFVKGHAIRQYSDMRVYLDVQPQGNDTVVAEDGKRRFANIISYGKAMIRVENVDAGILGDWLWYEGAWYECKSSLMYEHTPLAHYTCTFVLVTEAVADDAKLPPEAS